MNKEEAINLGIKIMKDISFLYDESDIITANYIGKGDSSIFIENAWLISFLYGKEDYGRNVDAHLTIDNSTERGIDISIRNGAIELGYDEGKDKYFVKKKRP